MKKILSVAAVAALAAIAGCKTVETVHAPADAYNIRKPADTTKVTGQSGYTIIERK